MDGPYRVEHEKPTDRGGTLLDADGKIAMFHDGRGHAFAFVNSEHSEAVCVIANAAYAAGLAAALPPTEAVERATIDEPYVVLNEPPRHIAPFLRSLVPMSIHGPGIHANGFGVRDEVHAATLIPVFKSILRAGVSGGIRAAKGFESAVTIGVDPAHGADSSVMATWDGEKWVRIDPSANPDLDAIAKDAAERINSSTPYSINIETAAAIIREAIEASKRHD